MRTNRPAALLPALFVASVLAQAAPTPAGYKHAQVQAIIDCGATPSDDAFITCIHERKAVMVEQYKALAATLGSQGAKDALVNVHVAFVAALQDSRPGPIDRTRPGAYHDRFNGLMQKYGEAWTRFELAQ